LTTSLCNAPPLYYVTFHLILVLYLCQRKPRLKVIGSQFFCEMILEAAIVILLLVLGWRMFFASSPKNLPPGPRPYPLIGNLTRLVGKPIHLAVTDLAKEYGEIYTLYLPGGQRCILINSIGLVREALLTKKDDFAGRPRTFIGDYLTREAKDIFFADFSQTMILQRKLAHSALRMYGSGLKHLEEKICGEVDQLLERFSAHNGKTIDPENDIDLMVLNVICAVVYGESYELEDEEFKRIMKYNNHFVRLFKGFNILEMLPWLRFLPLEEGKILREARELRDAVLDAKYRQHKKKFDDKKDKKEIKINDLTDALLKAFYEAQEEDGKVSQLLTEDHLVMIMNDVFNAGIQSTTATLLWLLAYMVTYPDTQARVHAEMDKLIGRYRKPRLEDRGHLPYLESTVAEILRIATTTPLSIPHKSTRDSTLGGYDIPKDTTIITNFWAIHHDPKEWENPDVFNPERFLDADGKFSASGPTGFRSYLPFSAGRRVCLGESLAKTELFLASSRLLHQFTFERAPGQPMPDLTGHVGVVFAPGSYKISIKNRI
ncbi:hypothetical protein ACROYT_G023768, partial [Oculina patagonica]